MQQQTGNGLRSQKIGHEHQGVAQAQCRACLLHSGSRGLGNCIGTYFIELAKKEASEIQVLIGYLPVVAALRLNADWLAGHGPVIATASLWIGFTAFMVIRGVTLWWRERGDAWLVTGLG